MNWKYLKYVLTHKWHVARFCFKYGLYWRGVKHDWSKFLPSEWRPYAHYFYGDVDKEYPSESKYVRTELKDWRKIQFDRAWLKHQHRNDHHWQHHVLREDSGATKALEMTYDQKCEMIADWCGAGIAITGKLEVVSRGDVRRAKLYYLCDRIGKAAKIKEKR